MIPLASQVGGHPGVQTSEDGSIVFKLVFAREMNFYQSLTSNPVSAALRPYIPKFYGVLGSEGQVEDGAYPPPKLEKDKYPHLKVHREITRMLTTTTRWIVLENLSHGFSKPNVIDIKLGTRFYDEEASEEKKERMIKAAKDSTSLETGLRLTGFQVSDTYWSVLNELFYSFCPFCQVYDESTGQAMKVPRSYGRELKVSELPVAITRFFPIRSEQSTQGLPKEQLLPIVEAIRNQVATIRGVFAQLEIRVVGGSFLIIYEGDPECGSRGTAPRDAEGEDEENTKAGPPCLVKLIDFAHTKVVEGEGPDEGVLLGMDTMLMLLDNRVSQIKDS